MTQSRSKSAAYFDVSVEQQLVGPQYNVFILELVARQQLGGSVAELQIVSFHQASLVCGEKPTQVNEDKKTRRLSGSSTVSTPLDWITNDDLVL